MRYISLIVKVLDAPTDCSFCIVDPCILELDSPFDNLLLKFTKYQGISSVAFIEVHCHHLFVVYICPSMDLSGVFVYFASHIHSPLIVLTRAPSTTKFSNSTLAQHCPYRPSRFNFHDSHTIKRRTRGTLSRYPTTPSLVSHRY